MSNTKIVSFLEVLILWGVVGGVLFSLFTGLNMAQGQVFCNNSRELDPVVVYQRNSLSANSAHYIPQQTAGCLINEESNATTYNVIVTAYSSSPDETDSSPYITASGDWVQDGIIATNFLSFGTRVRIPELFGDKVFTVQDRMHPRNKYHIDIWFPSRAEALEFGAHYTYIELVEG